MATRTVHLPESSYALLADAARQRGVDPDALADELVRADLACAAGEMESALADLAAFREGLPQIDGIALARESRAELERRGS